MSDPAYSASEMMIAVAARMLTGARTVFVGVGLPNIACNLARSMHLLGRVLTPRI